MRFGFRFLVITTYSLTLLFLVGCDDTQPTETESVDVSLEPDTAAVQRPGKPQPANTQAVSEAEHKQIAEAEHQFDLWCEKFLKNEDWEKVLYDYKVALVKSNKMGEKMDAEAFRGFLDSVIYYDRLDYILPTVPLAAQEKGLNLKGYKTVLEVFYDDAQELPPASSLHGYYRAFDQIMRAGGNISAEILARGFIEAIRPADFGKPFYQNIVLIFLIISVNESSGIESEFPKG